MENYRGSINNESRPAKEVFGKMRKNNDNIRKCPFCRLDILQGTVKCPHCSRILIEKTIETQVSPLSQSTSHREKIIPREVWSFKSALNHFIEHMKWEKPQRINNTYQFNKWKRIKIVYFIIILVSVVGLSTLLVLSGDNPVVTSTELPSFPTQLVNTKNISFVWKYKGDSFGIDQIFSDEVANFYHQDAIKTYTVDSTESQYYKELFINGVKPQDTLLDDFVNKIKKIALDKKLSSDDTLELAVTLVQSLPYDEAKAAIVKQNDGSTVEAIKSTWTRLPYETLYENMGICSDKSLLLVNILSKLGYGVALIDYPTHLAAAVQCPQDVSTYESGYCYIETTNEGFGVGELPFSVDGRGNDPDTIDADLNVNTVLVAEKLGSPTIIPLTKGFIYQRASEWKGLLDEQDKLTKEIYQKKLWLESETHKIDSYQRDVIDPAHSELISAEDIYKIFKDKETYNTYIALYKVYNSYVDVGNKMIKSYNNEASNSNKLVRRWKEISSKLSYE